jgi:group II intron reverse transcriptase/maturase
VNIGEMQRKLSLWAEQDKGHRFFDLYHLLHDRDWLRLAHDYVAQNAGSNTGGCDGITMQDFDEDLEGNLQAIAEALKTETFAPCPVRRVYIPNANGKLRPLGILAIRDRIVQEALRMILEPVYEADFSQYSFGFRPNRCTRDAIKCILFSAQASKRFFWVVEGDISSYFDTIHHRRLIKLLRRRVADEKLLRLIRGFLRAGAMEGKLFKDTKRGTPQGGIISPLLANVYLHELDRYMERYTGLSQSEKHRRRRQGLANYIYVRYADDFVVLCNGRKRQAEAIKEELFGFLRDRLRLSLSMEKTKVTHLNDGFDFLGFPIIRTRASTGVKTKVLIPAKAVEKLLQKRQAATDPGTHEDSVVTKLVAINRIIRGWCPYDQYTSKAGTQLGRIQHRLFWLVGRWLGRKLGLRMPQVFRRYYRHGTWGTEGGSLLLASRFRTRICRSNSRKPNPYTTQASLVRESLPHDTNWTGLEKRPGWADLRLEVLRRDGFTCQLCKRLVTADEAVVDHVRPLRFFKRPVDANYPGNLWTLCPACHEEKTESDRRMESRLR